MQSRSRRVAPGARAPDDGVSNEEDVELGRACAMRCDATRSIDDSARASSREPDARARGRRGDAVESLRVPMRMTEKGAARAASSATMGCVCVIETDARVSFATSQAMIESLSVVAAPDGTAAGALSASAISDHAGNIWGQSEHFPGFNAEEAKNLMALFADPIERASEGIIVGGSRYVFLNGGDDAGVVRGKRGSTHGIVVKKTKTAFVIGIHGDNLETRQVSAHVEQFGDYLASQGM